MSEYCSHITLQSVLWLPGLLYMSNPSVMFSFGPLESLKIMRLTHMLFVETLVTALLGKPGFLNIDTLDTLGYVIACCGDYPIHCRRFRSISGLFIRFQKDFPSWDQPKCLQKLTILQRARLPQVEDHSTRAARKTQSINFWLSSRRVPQGDCFPFIQGALGL